MCGCECDCECQRGFVLSVNHHAPETSDFDFILLYFGFTGWRFRLLL